MKRDSFPHELLDFLTRRTGCDAAWHVGRVCRKPAGRLLDNDQELHHFRPACLRMLLSVPGATSSPVAGWKGSFGRPS
jgi:hypothetical protein